MQVPNSRLLQCVLVALAGLTVSSVGCRSTRDSLSSLPGMTWLGPGGGASMGALADQGERPSLPPPSREATPQVVTGDKPGKAAGAELSATEYPNTGYPSLGSDRSRSAPASEGYVTGQYDTPRGAREGQPATTDNASVGQTQRGFYGEQYQASGSQPAPDYDPASSGEFPSTGVTGYDNMTGTDPDSIGGDRWADPPAGDHLSAAETADSPRPGSGFDQVRQGIRQDWQNTTQAISRNANEFTQGVQEFARDAGQEVREGVGDIRNGLKDEYQQFSQGASPQVPDSQQDPADRFDDYPVEQPGATGADPSGGPDFRATGQASPATPAQGPAEYNAAATLNPPADTAVNGRPPSDAGYSVEPTASPTRSVEPWRPGSTGDYQQSSPGQSRALTPSGQRPYVEPASYDGREMNSQTTAPATGWSHSQRLAPSYR